MQDWAITRMRDALDETVMLGEQEAAGKQEDQVGRSLWELHRAVHDRTSFTRSRQKSDPTRRHGTHKDGLFKWRDIPCSCIE